MRYCENCGVWVRGGGTRCPLCQTALAGAPCPEEELFPPLDASRRRGRMVLRVAAFVSLAAALVCAAVDLLLPPATFWSGYVAAGIGTGGHEHSSTSATYTTCCYCIVNGNSNAPNRARNRARINSFRMCIISLSTA